jgi:hypothetical protein
MAVTAALIRSLHARSGLVRGFWRKSWKIRRPLRGFQPDDG